MLTTMMKKKNYDNYGNEENSDDFDYSDVFISVDSHSNEDVDYDDYCSSGAAEGSWPSALSSLVSEMASLLNTIWLMYACFLSVS